MAEQAGIAVQEKKLAENYNNYSNYVSIKVTNNKNEVFTIAGTIASNGEGKLIELEGFEIDVKPSDYMLFIKNKDVPGVIGQVGTLVGEEAINVATMHVGRKVKGENAIMILTIDSEVSKETLVRFKEKENIISAKSVVL